MLIYCLYRLRFVFFYNIKACKKLVNLAFSLVPVCEIDNKGHGNNIMDVSMTNLAKFINILIQ